MYVKHKDFLDRLVLFIEKNNKFIQDKDMKANLTEFFKDIKTIILPINTKNQLQIEKDLFDHIDSKYTHVVKEFNSLYEEYKGLKNNGKYLYIKINKTKEDIDKLERLVISMKQWSLQIARNVIILSKNGGNEEAFSFFADPILNYMIENYKKWEL